MTALADDLLDVFMDEAHEVLDRLHVSLEILERRYASDVVIALRRDLHTFKGGARMCGMRLPSELAHAAETLVDSISSYGASPPSATLDILFTTEQEMRAALQRPVAGPGSDASVIALTQELRACCTPTAMSDSTPAGDEQVDHLAPALREEISTPATASPARAAGANPQDDCEDIPETVHTVPAPPLVDLPAAVEPIGRDEQAAPASVSVHGGLAAQLLEVFIEEAGEMLDILHTCLETLERRPDEAAMAEARRSVHTIKGGARMCGKSSIAELAHACEDVIGRPEPGIACLPEAVLQVLFEAENEMREALTVPASGAGSDSSVRTLVGRLRGKAMEMAGMRAIATSPAPIAGDSESPSQPSDSDSALNGAGADQCQPGGDSEAAATIQPEDEPASTDSLGADAGLIVDSEPQPVSLDKSQLLARPAIPPAYNQSNRVAVDLEKVEALVAKVTEIVANRTASHGLVETLANTVNEMARAVHRLEAIVIGLHYQITSHGYDAMPEQDADGLDLETYGPIRQLLLQLQEAAADQQALVQGVNDVVARKRALATTETRLDTELQGALLNMRLLPLSQLRVRLDQVVRTTAAAAHREVRWTMEGDDVALDKYVCDRLFEPLMHLLRNCVDHGIEPPDEREALGKPRVGRITVRASVEGSQVIVSVSDDGRGIDPDKIARIAVARGLLGADRAAALTTREKLELVFRPGFSTAKEVTELSGRGMGMEIVREACTRMGGSVSIGKRDAGGTIVVLQVPLSMAVVHCIVVRDAGRCLAIPATQISFVQLVPPTAVSKRQKNGHRVRIGTSELPLYFLPDSHLESGSPTKEFEERTVLVLPYRGDRVALAVDEIVEEEDQIVKPLPFLLQTVDRLLGAIVLGDGTPAPVLNLVPLLDQIGLSGLEEISARADTSGDVVVLVVDDSLTMRLALTRTLQHAGFTVETARDGQDALEHIRANGLPHLVTLDIEMPRMDGLEALYAIRHLPGGDHLPVFMLSSRTGKKHLRTAEKMGASRYFTKPYHDTEFIAAVREAIGLRVSAR